MKKRQAKLLSLFLTASMVLSAPTAAVYAAEGAGDTYEEAVEAQSQVTEEEAAPEEAAAAQAETVDAAQEFGADSAAEADPAGFSEEAAAAEAAAPAEEAVPGAEEEQAEAEAVSYEESAEAEVPAFSEMETATEENTQQDAAQTEAGGDFFEEAVPAGETAAEEAAMTAEEPAAEVEPAGSPEAGDSFFEETQPVSEPAAEESVVPAEDPAFAGGEAAEDGGAEAVTEGAYVLMNIPYAKFFAAEGIGAVDAVSTATVKTYNQTMAGGSYHAGYAAADPISGAQILGVTYPVYVEDLSVLEGLTVVTDADTATITVATGKSTTGDKEVSGKDLLFASGDYAYYVMNGEPANYKTLSVADGDFTFSAVQNGAAEASLVSAEMVYTGHHTNLELNVEANEIGDSMVTGVVLTTSDGTGYVLRHVENIWRKVSLGWNWTDLDGAGLAGRTITGITYYLQDGGVYHYPVELTVKQPLSGVGARFTGAGSVEVTGIPADAVNARAKVSSVVGRGQTPVVIAENAEIVNGLVTIPETAAAVSGTAYNIQISSDNYADVVVRAAWEEMAPVNIGGTNYYYTETTGDIENTTYQFTVSSRAGKTTYTYTGADLAAIGETGYSYVLLEGVTPLTGTLYGYVPGTGTATNYKEVYAGLGVSTDTDSAYDAVSSATGFSGHHAKDIPSLVTYGTDADGEKAITGLVLGREMQTVDAAAYVEASVLRAAGKELTAEQEAVLAVPLKTNPMSAPAAQEVPVQIGGASLAASRYGIVEFDLVPNDSVEGYTWSEYWSNVYAATVSDGTTTVGAVHWIDLYGEAAVSGPHYNKVQVALNNGTSTASNQADVSRYASFFENGHLKPAVYTVTVYAEGYAPLTAQVDVGVRLEDKTAVYTGEAISIDPAVENWIDGDIVYTYYSDEACTQALAGAPTAPGTYYVKAVAADLLASNTAKLTINKAASSVTLKAKTATYTGKAVNIDAATVKGSTGKVTYTYYSDAGCTKKVTAHVNAGTYYVKAQVAADQNYKAATSKAVKLVIGKAASTVTLKAKTATYTGKAINIGAATVKGSKGKVTYTYYKDAKCTKKVTAHVNAGTYYVKAQVAADTNYKAAVSKAARLVIKKKAQTVTASVSSKTFTVKAVKAKAQTFAIGAKASGKGKLSYAKSAGSKYLTVNKTNGRITVKKGTPKGTYTIKVKITAAANTNYNARTITKTVKVIVK